jgi:hypothetical protein
MPLLKELGRASRVGVTINMALLTELDTSPSLKIHIRSRVSRRTLMRDLDFLRDDHHASIGVVEAGQSVAARRS